jgi:hypothetical protein
MKVEANVKRLRTTVGDLVVAMVDAALKAGGSEKDAYCLTGFFLNRMLQPAPAKAARLRGCEKLAAVLRRAQDERLST